MPRAMLPLWRCKSTSFLSSEVNMSDSMATVLNYSLESVKIYLPHISDNCPLKSVCTCLWKCEFFVLKVTQMKANTPSAVLTSRWFLGNELVEYIIYMDFISVQIPIFCTHLINWIHYQFH